MFKEILSVVVNTYKQKVKSTFFNIFNSIFRLIVDCHDDHYILCLTEFFNLADEAVLAITLGVVPFLISAMRKHDTILITIVVGLVSTPEGPQLGTETPHVSEEPLALTVLIVQTDPEL